MKKLILPLLILLVVFFAFRAASAHQPYVVKRETTEVQNPETSRAYYGELKGGADYFVIRSDKSFDFYISILSPETAGARKDFFVDVYKGEDREDFPFLTLDPQTGSWQKTFEPFARDNYYQGPEHEQRLEPGTYAVMVSNPGYQGKYVLAIGKKERFSPSSIARSLAVMPQVKSFLGKSPLTAYFNPFGLFLWIPLVLLIALVWYLKKKFRGQKTVKSKTVWRR